MTEEEADKIINDIACRVYEVDSSYPDAQQFAIEREIKELLNNLGVVYED